MCRIWVTLVGWCLVVPTSTAADTKVTSTEIARLIEQLGDRDYATRETATKRLTAIGEPALALLTAVPRNQPERAERAARLMTSIRDRIENESTIAPSFVEIPAGELTVREMFEAIEGQCRFKLRVDGEQSALSRRVKWDGGRKPFWDAVYAVTKVTGLGVGEVYEFRAGSVRQTAEDEADMALLLSNSSTRSNDARKLADHMDEIKAQIAKSTDAKEKAELANDLARVNRYYQKLTGIDTRVEERKKSRASLLGLVTLKATPKANPVCVSGAVRIEAVPASPDLLKRYAPEHLPLSLTVHAEPRVEWGRVSETLIVEAIGPNGRPVPLSYFDPKGYSTLANDELQFRRARLGLREGEGIGFTPPSMGLVALTAPAEGQPLTLKSVRGLVKAAVWTSLGELVTVSGDDGGESRSDGTVLIVKPVELDETMKATRPPIRAGYEVTVQYDPVAVRPLGEKRSQTNDPLWLGNGPRGRAVPFGGNDTRRFGAKDNQYGLTFEDADGKPVNVSFHTVTTTTATEDDRPVVVMKLKVYARGSDANGDRPLAKVAFHGNRLKDVCVPFQLADVPLTPGTGDGKPLPDDYSERLKR